MNHVRAIFPLLLSMWLLTAVGCTQAPPAKITPDQMSNNDPAPDAPPQPEPEPDPTPDPLPDAAPDPTPDAQPDAVEPDPTPDPTPDPRPDADPDPDPTPDHDPDPNPDPDNVTHECAANESACTSWDTATACVTTPQGRRWQAVDCGRGEGCFQGSCTAERCSDECHWGERNNGRGCELYDIRGERFIEVDEARMHDRARGYEKWLRNDTASLLHGGIVSVRYTDTDLDEVDRVYFGDTPLHTGIYLAAEAHRLSATGSPRARKNVRKLVETNHLWFTITGDPGNLATIAARAGDRRLRDWSQWDCGDFDRFCDIEFDGERWDYVGDPSRDMYMGPLLGLPIAYDALGEHDEAHRALIRQDLMAFAEELVRLRTLTMVLEINGIELLPEEVQTRFFIPDTRDMNNGMVRVTIDLNDIDNSGDVRGGQEFLPNPTRLLNQIDLIELILGGALPDIVRASSALMVPAAISAALHVTEGVPAWAERREALRRFYYDNDDEWGNIDTWLDAAGQWINDRECGERYFGINLAMIPAFILAQYETSAPHRARLLNEVLRDKLWDYVHDHHNSFFSFMYAEVQPQPDPAIAQRAADDLNDFPTAPRQRREMDLRGGRYGQMDGCGREVAARAVDMSERPVRFFQWHSSPFDLVETGSARQTYPGHDYLVAYWMGRDFGFIGDDTSHACLRWR